MEKKSNIYNVAKKRLVAKIKKIILSARVCRRRVDDKRQIEVLL